MMKAYNLRQPPKGLVFHSDRGSQYTSKHYRKLLPVTISERVWAMLERVGIMRLLNAFSVV